MKTRKKSNGVGIMRACAAFVLLFLLLMSSCGKTQGKVDTKSVGKVSEFDVPYEELRYVVLTYRGMLENKYGEGIFENGETCGKYRPELEKFVTDNITANYAVLSLCDEVGISPERSEIQKAVKDYMKNFIKETGGSRKYKEELKKYNLTDRLFRFNISVDYCQNELLFSYTRDLGLIEDDNNEILKKIKSEFVRTLHVFVRNDPGDDTDENRRKAEKARDRLKAGESIIKLIGGADNEDFKLTTTDGYYFTREEMVKPYEDAAFALETGEVSDVVETADGFYVIQRFELDEKYIDENFETLKENYQHAKLNKFIDDRQKELKFEFNEYGRTLNLTAMK